MRFTIIVSALVALFVIGFLAYPHIPGFISAITPKPAANLAAWVDTTEYMQNNCTIKLTWTLANGGATAHDVLVRISVLESGQIVAYTDETVGTIEKDQERQAQAYITDLCRDKDTSFVVNAEIISYST